MIVRLSTNGKPSIAPAFMPVSFVLQADPNLHQNDWITNWAWLNLDLETWNFQLNFPL